MKCLIAWCLPVLWIAMASASDIQNNSLLHKEVLTVPPAVNQVPPSSRIIDSGGKDVFIPTLPNSIAIDGELNEPQWQRSTHLTLDYVTQPYDNVVSPVNTDVYVFEDGQTLFIGFVAQDPNPSAIRAFYRDRDDIWSNDLVGIKLDTFNNQRLAYQFFVNPYGVQADAVENEMTGEESDSWNAIWQSAGRLTESGYVVEMAIPMRAMNFNESGQDKIWGAEFVRFYPRQNSFRLSNVPFDRNNACTLCQMGKVRGFRQATQGKNLAIVPTAVFGKGRSRDVFATTREWDSVSASELGLDVTWGISPQMSLQATLNPDFSQVEADVAQVSVNNTFSLYFDEKRPFFVENADYFSTNQTLVYTRNISAPDFGSKLTGQINNHTFGVFVANDEQTTFIVPGNIGSDVVTLDEQSRNGAIRYRYDVSNDLSVGYVGTFRDSAHYNNYVSGMDLKYRLTEQDTLELQWVASDTTYPSDLYRGFCDATCTNPGDYSEAALRTRQTDSFFGTAWRMNYEHEERNWFLNAEHYANEKDFRADLGFETKADYYQSVLGGGYLWWRDSGWWNRIRVNGEWSISHNSAGALIKREFEGYASVRGTLQSLVELGVVRRERVGLRLDSSSLNIGGNTTRFEEKQINLYLETSPNSRFFLSNYVSVGDQIDFAHNRLGDEVYTESQIDMNIGEHAQLRVMHTFNALEAEGEPLFTARLTDMRLSYQFDTRQLLRLIVSYSNTTRNPDNYQFKVDPKTRELSGQLLYSYKLNPLTRFFVGVGATALESNPLASIKTQETSIFIKCSYAWLQ